jgi:hypothetical protein
VPISFKPITEMISELLQECAEVMPRNLGTGELADASQAESVPHVVDASGESLEAALPLAQDVGPDALLLPSFSHEELNAAKPNYDRLMRGGDAQPSAFEVDTLPSLPKATVTERVVTPPMPTTTPRALINQGIVAPPVLAAERRETIQLESSGARGNEDGSQQQSGEETEDEPQTQEPVPELTEADILQRVRRQNLKII